MKNKQHEMLDDTYLAVLSAANLSLLINLICIFTMDSIIEEMCIIFCIIALICITKYIRLKVQKEAIFKNKLEQEQNNKKNSFIPVTRKYEIKDNIFNEKIIRIAKFYSRTAIFLMSLALLFLFYSRISTKEIYLQDFTGLKDTISNNYANLDKLVKKNLLEIDSLNIKLNDFIKQTTKSENEKINLKF